MTADFPRTRVSRAEWSDNRYRGYSVARDLAAQETWLGMMVLGVTGRRLNAADRGVLDDLAVAMSVADPRIWPLKLTRLVAAYGGTLPALAAGALSLDEAAIGHWTTGEAASFLKSVRDSVASPDDAAGIAMACGERLATGRRLVGYGVAFRPVDERVAIVTERMRARGRDQLEYWTLYLHVSEAVFRLKGLRPNIGIASAAICLDLGFDAREAAIVISFLALSDVLANASEGAAQAPAALRTLEASCIRYVGPAPRETGRCR